MSKDCSTFFALKHAIDDQVARLGWTKERCVVYIKDRYGVRSRLAMTDDQLGHLLKVLSSMKAHATSKRSTNQVGKKHNRSHRRRHN